MLRLVNSSQGMFMSTPREVVDTLGLDVLALENIQDAFTSKGLDYLLTNEDGLCLVYDFAMNMIVHVQKSQAYGGRGNTSIKCIDWQDLEDARGDLYAILVKGMKQFTIDKGLCDFETFKLVTSRVAFKIGNAYAYRSHRAIAVSYVDAQLYDEKGKAHPIDDLTYDYDQYVTYEQTLTSEETRKTNKVLARVENNVPCELLEKVHNYLGETNGRLFMKLLSVKADKLSVLSVNERKQLSRLTTTLLTAYNLETGNARKLKASERKLQDLTMKQNERNLKQARVLRNRLNAYVNSKEAFTRRLETILSENGLELNYRQDVSRILNAVYNRAYTSGETLEVLRPYRIELALTQANHKVIKPLTESQLKARGIVKNFQF